MKNILEKNSGAIVLGVNDALVEISGAIVGLSFALSNTKLIALAGSIMGVSAALSMSASEYLSAKEENKKSPLTLATFTGVAYIISVLILILPYFLFENLKIALISMIISGIGIIFIYTLLVSRAKKCPFTKKFTEMLIISCGVAIISFGFTTLLKHLLKISM